MKVLIADDQAEVRSAIKILLEQEYELDVLDEVEDAGSLYLKTRKMCPDLILLDWELSNRTMTDAVPVLRGFAPGLRIIALSGRPEAEKTALMAGVDAFVSKGERPEKLLDAIKAIRL